MVVIFIFNLDYAIKMIKENDAFKLLEKVLDNAYAEFSEDEFILICCEMYKIVNRNLLISYLNTDNNSDIKVVPMTKEYEDKDIDKYKRKIRDLGFYVYHYDKPNSTITLATEMSNVDNPRLDIIFPDLKVERVALTPYNYYEIKEGKLPIKSRYLESILRPYIIFLRLVAECYLMKGTDIRFYCYKGADSFNYYGTKVRIGNELVQLNLFQMDEDLNKRVIEDVISRTIYNSAQLEQKNGIQHSMIDPFKIGDLSLRLKFNKSIAGYSGNVRIVGVKSLTDSIESLGFDSEVNEVVRAMTRVEDGLCLVTGPQRSGKSTTLISVFNEIVKKPISVAEFSSPVETPLLLDAFEYSNEEELLALTASAKKLDLDVALLNEIPASSVAKGVYDLVNSSVGVFSTLHISRIWHLPYKLEEYFGDKMINVITYLRYVLNQKALILQCPHCLESLVLKDSKEIYPEVMDICKEFGIEYYMKSVGCDICGNTGVRKGIQPFVEYVKFDNKLKSELARCSRTYEMEEVIRKHVSENNCGLEYFMKKALLDGSIHPNQLLALL